MSSRLLGTFLPAFLLSLAVLACGGTGSARTSATQPAETQSSSGASVDTTLAHVDSIDVPAQIATTDTLSAHLYGGVGPNGCYALARIEEERAPGQVTLLPIVQYSTAEDRMCTMAVVSLDTTHAIAPPFQSGTLTVTVPQSDGPPVTATVEITEGS